MKRPVSAYPGSEPYVFVCYAHDDAHRVYPELVRLRDAGFHIWYDEGIPPGLEWSQQLADHIEGCAVFLFFVTPRSVEREHCRREVNFALEQQCSMLAVHLEPTEVPSALQLSLSNRQAILRYELSAARYYEKLDAALEQAAAGRSLNGDVEVGSSLQPFRLGQWDIDPGSGKLRNGQRERHLPPQTMAVLIYLVQRGGDIVSNDELLENVWKGRFTADDSVYHHIGRIRKALGDSRADPQFIETIPRRGYRLSVEALPLQVGGGDEEIATNRPAGPAIAVALAAGLLLAIAAIGGWFWWSPPAQLEPGTPRVVVTGFDNLSADPELGYTANGLAQDVENELATMHRIELITGAPNAASAADYSVEGSIGHVDGNVRLSVRLLRRSNGGLVWSEHFDEPPDVGDAIRHLHSRNIARFVEGMASFDVISGQANPAARDHYRRAMQEYVAWSLGLESDWTVRLRYLKRAAEADPAFFAPKLMLALAYIQRLGFSISWREASTGTNVFLPQALALAPDDCIVLHVQAQAAYTLDLDYGSALEGFERAHAACDDTGVHFAGLIDLQLGYLYRNLGNFETALAYLNTGAREGAFFDQAYVRMNQGIVLALMGKPDEAKRFLDQAWAISGKKGNGVPMYILMWQILACHAAGDEACASETLDDAWARFGAGNAEWFPALFALLGREEKAKTLLEQMQHRHQRGQWVLSMEAFRAYYHLGDHAEAFRWLDLAIEDRQWPLFSQLRSPHFFQDIREDPRFRAAMERLEALEVWPTERGDDHAQAR